MLTTKEIYGDLPKFFVWHGSWWLRSEGQSLKDIRKIMVASLRETVRALRASGKPFVVKEFSWVVGPDSLAYKFHE